MNNDRQLLPSLIGQARAEIPSAEWCQSLFEQHPDAVVSIDRQGCVVGFNQAFARLTGYRASDGIGRPCSDWLVVEQEGAARPESFCAATAAAHRECRAILIGKDGRRMVRKVQLLPVVIGGEVVGQHIVVKGPWRKRKPNGNRERPIRHDPLTHLPDWSFFNRALQEAIEEARRSRTLLAILLVDLDRFQLVNDVLGHQQGDQLLREAADKLLSCVRRCDAVARIGGDKFSLMLRGIQREEQVHRIAKRMLARFQEPFQLGDGQEIFITPSIGISLYPLAGNDADELLRHADTAMSRAKEKGGNTYQMFDSSMAMELSERLMLESSLRKAVARGELQVYYQPQIDLSTRRLIGLEALLRWNHPEKGWILPSRFIPIAEESGAIQPITEWLLEHVCAQNKAWQGAGLPSLRISVNLSPLLFDQGDPAALVERIVRQTGLDPKWLGLEITESVLMKSQATVSALKRLKAMGVYISVDDFGTGYSSLGYLKRFPIDCLKIDQSFVRNVMNDADNAAIVGAIITLAHQMKLYVIAEGVEKEEELRYLANNGCDAVQGYLLGKPMPAEECARLLSLQHDREFAIGC